MSKTVRLWVWMRYSYTWLRTTNEGRCILAYQRWTFKIHRPCAKDSANVIATLRLKLNCQTSLPKRRKLHDLKAKYTLMFSTLLTAVTASMRYQNSIRLQASLKSKGVKISTVVPKLMIQRSISLSKRITWKIGQTLGILIIPVTITTNWRIQHPTIYLLDEKKIIKGKRLDHSNIGGLMIWLRKTRQKRKKRRRCKP